MHISSVEIDMHNHFWEIPQNKGVSVSLQTWGILCSLKMFQDIIRRFLTIYIALQWMLSCLNLTAVSSGISIKLPQCGLWKTSNRPSSNHNKLETGT